MPEDRMNAPFIFITTHTVKDGRLEDLEALNAEFVDFVESHEPDIIGLHAYLSEDRTRLTLIQIHPDAASLEHHLRVAGDKIHQAFELVDNERVDAYGSPGETARTLLERLREAGLRVAVNPARMDGLMRYAVT
jgi:peptidoglycan/xylan/chitin deacetylase (PgdA/CDA1 family)